MADYAYTVSVDFGGTEPDLSLFHQEILDSSISSATLDGIKRGDPTSDDVVATFDTTLSGADETTLDGLVSAHSPPTYTTEVTVSDEVSTSSAVYILCPSMTLIVEGGVYLATYSAIVKGSNNGTKAAFAVFLDGVEVTNSERRMEGTGEQTVANSARITANQGSVVELRWMKAAGGSITSFQRALTIS